MPIFTYVCKDCGANFDLLVGVVAEQEEMKCKKCGSENIEKTFAPFGVGKSSSSSNSSSSCPTGTCPLT